MLSAFLVCLATLLLALLVDFFLGEPRRAHPLVGFGNLANWLEQRLNRHPQASNALLLGACGWIIAMAPISLGFYWFNHYLSLQAPGLSLAANVIVLYLCIGWRSLKEHVQAIHQCLQQGNLATARQACAMIVSRETHNMNENQICRAAVESTIENGNDGIYATLFWFAFLGIPGAVLFRLCNTLDAMWGYRNPRFEKFGKCAAYADDMLGFIPARLTASFYCCYPLWQSGTPPKQRWAAVQRSWQRWHQQARLLASPNAGPVMVSGAQALNLQLGGPAVYHGQQRDKPFFGGDIEPQPHDINRALDLIDLSLGHWLICASLLAACSSLLVGIVGGVL